MLCIDRDITERKKIEAELRRNNKTLITEVAERRAADEALRRAEFQLRTIVANLPVVVFALDGKGVFTLSEGKALDALGRKPGQVVGESIFDVYENVPAILESVRKGLAGESSHITVDVAGVTFQAVYEPVRNEKTEVVGVFGFAADMSHINRLEEQLLQAQKLEAVGRLAGGVAHDFNNLLTTILGYSHLGLAGLPSGDRLEEVLHEIQKAAERATDVTSQLLLFSRRRTVETSLFDLNELIVNVHDMLRRLIGEDIEIVTLPSTDDQIVLMNAALTEQVLINLAVNARDAMPEGGKLIIKTETVTLIEEAIEGMAGLPPGDYVLLTIDDTGTGMTKEIKDRAFEPFFTTKDVDRGTGLGLSTSHGIVAQAGGHIIIDTELGRGTTFEIYFPKAETSVTTTQDHAESQHLPIGDQTLLLVEDEETVRGFASKVLRQQGYTVLEAGNGEEAMRLVQQRSRVDIDLVLTDIVMPLLGGKKLVDQLRLSYPMVKVIFVSGYMGDPVEGDSDRPSGEGFLQKPFTPLQFAQKVHDVLRN